MGAMVGLAEPVGLVGPAVVLETMQLAVTAEQVEPVVLVEPRDGSAMVVPAGPADKAGREVVQRKLCTPPVVLVGLAVLAGPVVPAASG